MAFTYDTATDIGKLRLEIGDTTYSEGVKPDGTNFSDAELQVWLTREGDVNRATAAACEALARMWARVADISIGPRKESLGTVSKRWAEEAKHLREQYGGAGEECYSIGGLRVDGFSDDDPSDAVETTGSEYEGDFTYVRPA